MSQQRDPKPPQEWLQHLHDAQQWDRLIEIASKSLAADPHDPQTHIHIAWGYLKTDRFAKMEPHVDFLLKADANSAPAHHLAALWHFFSKRPRNAKPHLEWLLQEDPSEPVYHYLACLVALRLGKTKDARRHVTETRRLAPDWADAVHLEVQMDGTRQTKARHAWERIRRLEEALSLEPGNAAIHASIGEIYLTELESPRDAERFFRQALALDPTDKDRQKKLLTARRAQSLLYRTLSLPGVALDRFRRHTSPILLLIAFKFVAVFLGWAIAMSAIFLPAAAIYEWFVLTETMQARKVPRLLAPLKAMLRWPLWTRLLLCGTIILGAWTLLLVKVFGVTPGRALIAMSMIFGVHFALVTLFVTLGRLRSRLGRWSDTRRQRKLLRRSGLTQLPAGHAQEV